LNIFRRRDSGAAILEKEKSSRITVMGSLAWNLAAISHGTCRNAWCLIVVQQYSMLWLPVKIMRQIQSKTTRNWDE